MFARILIVDDRAPIRAMLKATLEHAGHDVVGEATNGVEAVKLFRKHWPELVIMDLVMPVLSGTEASLLIRKLEPEAKIIPMSGLSQYSVRKEAAGAGMQGFLEKPLQREHLLQEIEAVLTKTD